MNFQLKKGDDDDKDHDTVICGSHFRSCAVANKCCQVSKKEQFSFFFILFSAVSL